MFSRVSRSGLKSVSSASTSTTSAAAAFSTSVSTSSGHLPLNALTEDEQMMKDVGMFTLSLFFPPHPLIPSHSFSFLLSQQSLDSPKNKLNLWFPKWTEIPNWILEFFLVCLKLV
eukprot:TRINITY_DN9142_c0_g1_i3.p1 TRINITY_DN9142_c0_g1~~TRINITY_DN9142_c0_g1_i3.p1  ORF type:complete len:115 (-),score=28.14 TRINITY_DN9142_c0_g1_i3:281-625(-)